MTYLFCPVCEEGKEVLGVDEWAVVKCEKCGSESDYWRWLAKTNEIRSKQTEKWKKEALKMEARLTEKKAEEKPIIEKITPPEAEEMEKRTPIKKEWIPLGETYGISITEWDNGISLIKRKKDESGNWHDLQTFNLSPKIMAELFVRIPIWFRDIKNFREERE